MGPVVFVPLAHGIFGNEINKNAKERCGAALFEAWEINRSSLTEVILAFGAGAIPGSGSNKTLAEYTEEYFLKVRADLPMMVNRCDSEVYGTLSEILWIIQEARQNYTEPRFVIVSQSRHIYRVKLMHRWFFADASVEFLVSGQTEEISPLHEFFAYSKLLMVKIGLGKFAESTRRFTARFTKW